MGLFWNSRAHWGNILQKYNLFHVTWWSLHSTNSLHTASSSIPVTPLDSFSFTSLNPQSSLLNMFLSSFTLFPVTSYPNSTHLCSFCQSSSFIQVFHVSEPFQNNLTHSPLSSFSYPSIPPFPMLLFLIRSNNPPQSFHHALLPVQSSIFLTYSFKVVNISS